MPTYEFECQKCFDRHEIIMKMTEIDAYPKVCSIRPDAGKGTTQHDVPLGEGLGEVCGGELVQVYDRNRAANHIWLCGKPTPRFGPVNRG